MFLSLRLWVACAYLSWTGRWRTNGEVMSISTPHITSQRETATEAIIIVIKNAFLQELMCSRLPTWTSLLSCRKKHKALLTFLHNTIKTPPPPTPTLPSDVSLVKLSHWDMLLSAHSPLWKGFLCLPSAASVKLQGIFQPAMCIRWSRAQGTMLSPTLVGHHG